MSSSQIRVYVFMGIITLISSLLLSYSYSALKKMSDDNEKFDKQRNIVKSIGLDINTMTKDQIASSYNNNIEEIILDYHCDPVNTVLWDDLVSFEDKKTGVTYFINKKEKIKFNALEDKQNDKSIHKYLPVFYHKSDKAYIIPISGKGLWSTLFGFIALASDKNTVKGITFFKHKETPGLGGEVDKEWFQSNFIGKKIFDAKDRLVSVEVIKGKSNALSKNKQNHAVDGITGATITSKGLSDFLLRDLLRYERFLRK